MISGPVWESFHKNLSSLKGQ
ncbi:unnamed protein product [Linum tenue]|uniref:Uncharacterized protein n=1 Tax=Linum tenue TaxID=586396 RepID=A0AAV0HV02_9ROSI|nr:unnamed protein product [Linum tenue]